MAAFPLSFPTGTSLHVLRAGEGSGQHRVPRAPPPASCPPRTSQGSAREGPSPPKRGTVLLSHLSFLLLDFNSGPEGSQGLEVMI